jgi:hypothetical protein
VIGDKKNRRLYVTFSIHIPKHRRGDVDRKNVIAKIRLMFRAKRYDRVCMTHASVKKPTPATRHTLTWNQLVKDMRWHKMNSIEKTYENSALSTSAKAARRRSSRT